MPVRRYCRTRGSKSSPEINVVLSGRLHYAYNRALFLRVSHGFYQLSPTLEVRCRQPEGESWMLVGLALNLPLIKEFAVDYYKPALERYLGAASRAPRPAEPLRGRAEASGSRTDSSRQEALPVEEELEEERLGQMLEVAPDEPRWGTPEARLREMARRSCGSTSKEGAKRAEELRIID